MKTLSKAPRKGILVALLLVLFSQWAEARQQHSSIDKLKEQIARLEAIDRNSATPEEVRAVNRNFIDTRRAELRGLLARRRDSLRAYLKAGDGVLRPEEAGRVEQAIRELDSQLSGLGGGSGMTAPLAADAGAAAPKPAADGGSFLSGSLLGQSPCPDNQNQLISEVVLSTSPLQNTLEVRLAAPLSLSDQPPDVTIVNTSPKTPQLNIPASHFKITAEAGTTKVTLTPVGQVTTVSGFGRRKLFINLREAIPADGTKVTVVISGLAFDCADASGATPTSAAQISGSGNITSNEVLSKAAIEALNKANKDAAAKRSNDKNFRMGFAAAKGDGKDAQGAADISINKTFFGGGQKTGTLFDLFDQADVALQLKKSSAEKADPRHLTLGLNLRKSFLIDSRLTSNSTAEAVLRNQRQGKGFFRVLMIKEGLNLEGEAFDFKTTNFVSDTHFEVASIAKKLGSGFYNINFFAGPELGRNLAKPDAAAVAGATAEQLAKADWIARFKAGGEFTLRLLPSGSGDNWGVELNLGYVNRYLFSEEVFTQETKKDGATTSKLVTVGKGNKAWRQADLKVFFFGDGTKRYGLKVSYNNGQLPPAFTPTRGFQFGMVVESSDDKQGGGAANNQ